MRVRRIEPVLRPCYRLPMTMREVAGRTPSPRIAITAVYASSTCSSCQSCSGKIQKWHRILCNLCTEDLDDSFKVTLT